jgi:pilus assembly protein Flp/PilA
LIEKWIEKGMGQGMVEYALILVLIALLVITILTQMGPSIGNVFSVMMLVFDPDPEGPTEVPEECYSTLLLPIMVGGTSILVSFSSLISKKRKEEEPLSAIVEGGLQHDLAVQPIDTG